MGTQKVKQNYRRRSLRLPDLDHCKRAELNSLGSPASRRVYEYAIDQFIAWYCSEPRLAFNRIVVVRYRMHLESRGLAANTSAFCVLHLSRIKSFPRVRGRMVLVARPKMVLAHAYGQTYRIRCGRKLSQLPKEGR